MSDSKNNKPTEKTDSQTKEQPKSTKTKTIKVDLGGRKYSFANIMTRIVADARAVDGTPHIEINGQNPDPNELRQLEKLMIANCPGGFEIKAGNYFVKY